MGAIIIIAAALTVTLCLCLNKEPNEDESPEELSNIKNNINLEIYSDKDDKEIFFLSEDYQLSQKSLRNLEESIIIYIDKKNIILLNLRN